MQTNSPVGDKKILIIVRDFVPYAKSLGWAIRALKMSNFLLDNGFDVFILCAKGVKISYYGYANLVDRIKVFYLQDPLQMLRNRTQRALMKISEDCDSAKNHDVLLMIRTILVRLVIEIMNLIGAFSFPDPYACMNHLYYKKAEEIIEKEKIKNVIISSPTFSIQLIGLKLKKRFGERINLVTDYRDSWNLGLYKKQHRPFQLISETQEINILRNADSFIYVSPPILEKIKSNYFDIASKSILVMNGFDDSNVVESNCTNENPILTMGYFGNIDPEYRAVEPFLRMLSNFDKEVRICFFGTVVIDQDIRMKHRGRIQVNGLIDHQEALKRMQNMDVLLILHGLSENADEVITGKFSDYLLVQKPILVVGPNNMFVARLVRENKLGYTMDICNEKEMLDNMNRVYADWRSNRFPRYYRKDLKVFSSKLQFEKILPILR